MTPLVVSQTPGPVPPWAQPPVVGDDGSMVVAMGGWEGPHGIVWIETDGTIAITHLLPDGMTISSGQPMAPSGPPLAPVLAGDRAFLAVTLQAGARIDDADRPVGMDALPGSLVNTEGTNDLGMDTMLALDRGGPVAGLAPGAPGAGLHQQVRHHARWPAGRVRERRTRLHRRRRRVGRRRLHRPDPARPRSTRHR